MVGCCVLECFPSHPLLARTGSASRAWERRTKRCILAFRRYCHDQYCVVYSLQTRVRRGSRTLLNNRAIVLDQGGQCRWVGGNERRVDSWTTALQ